MPRRTNRKSRRSIPESIASTARKLFAALKRVKPSNKQGEYYLTDVPEILLSDGEKVNVYLHGDAREVSGINTRAELAEFENLMRRSTIRKLMIEAGVTFIDPSHAYISAEASSRPRLHHLSRRFHRGKVSHRRRL